MLRFAMAQMRTSVGKLVAAAIAILLGTAFITGSLMATEVVTATARAAVLAETNEAALIVDGPENAKHVAAISEIDGVTGVDVQHELGLVLGTGGANRTVTMDDLPVHGPQPALSTGWLPTASGEITISHDLSKSLKLSTGDSVTWRSLSGDHHGTLLITGITRDSLMSNRTPIWAAPDTIAQLEPVLTDEDDPYVADTTQLHVYAAPDVDQNALSREVEAQIGQADAHVRTQDEFVADQLQWFVGDAHFFTTFALGFAAVSMVVAGMVITNTFEVLVAQRAHTLALMRCAGATKGQIRRSVLFEALALGIAASLAGVATGITLVHVAIRFLRNRVFGLEVPGILDLHPNVFIAPLIVGVLITTLAAFGPARVATRVAPVEALRPQSAPKIRSGSRVRLVLGVVSLAVGLVLLFAPGALILATPETFRNMDTGPLLPLAVGILGGLLTVAGVLILSVFVVPSVIRLLGTALAKILPGDSASTARLATANAVRNPRRTAATTSALVIGVGLVVMMSTGAATARVSISDATATMYPGDVWVQSFEEGLSEESRAVLEDTDGVVDAAPIWTTSLWTKTQAEMSSSIAVADPAKLNAVLAGVDLPTDFDGVLLPEAQFKELGEPKELAVSESDSGYPSMKFPVRVQEGFSWMGAFMSEKVARESFSLGQPHAYIVDVDDSHIDEVVNTLQARMAEADPNASLMAVALERQMIDQVVDALLAVLIGLLGVAVIIALVGVANTLSLSVIERRREHGMLRAVGVTRPQLRHMLTVEGILIAVAGIAIGVILGVATGLAGSAIILGFAATFHPALDWRVLVGCFLVAILAGALASVLPARAATRVPVVTALAD